LRSIAALYDMQHDPTLRDEMTYVSPTSGDRVGLSFIIPRTKQELELRRTMMLPGARDVRHGRPLAGLHERHLRGLERGRRVLRAGRPEFAATSGATTSTSVRTISR